MARYTDSLLMDGEHVVYRTRQHPLGRIAAARWGILMVEIAIAALLAIVIFNPGGTARDLLGWITLGLLVLGLSLIHISEPTRLGMISYAVFCLKKKKNP